MNPDSPNGSPLRQLFDACVDRSEAEQAALIDAWRDLTPAQRAQVRAWLVADRAEGQTGRIARMGSLSADWQQAQLQRLQDDWRGRRIGAFQLVELIGRGGMGSVWLANRVEGGFEQRVAIKLLSSTSVLDTRHAQRLIAEREMLATLRHPGIAQLLDGGETDDGTPYLVMEFVEGQRIDQWCAATACDLQERVRLLLCIADALQAAHATLVIHRDLKPANILVDTHGQVRLVDFGIARVLDAPMASAPATEHGERLMTLAYASPEQIRGEPTGIASDVYSLGVVAYELLSGLPAHASGDSGLMALVQSVCEHDPPAPSGMADESMRRQGMGRELDAIILKAMRKTATDRYPTVAALADDLRRWQGRVPVEALRSDRWYVWRKRLQRSRVTLTVSALVLSLLIATALHWRWQSEQLARERDKALLAVRFLTTLFERANPASHRGDVPDAVDIAEQGAERLLRDSTLSVDLRAELSQTSGRVLLALGQYQRASEVAEFGLAELQESADTSTTLRAELHLLQSDALAELAQWDLAIAAVERARLAVAEQDESAEARLLAIRVLDRRARIDFERNALDAAERSLSEALPAMDAWFSEMDALDAHRALALQGAELRASLLLTECRLAVHRAPALQARNCCEAAQVYREQVFPADHPARLNVLQELATLVGNQGDGPAARDLSRRLLEQTRRIYGDDHPRTAVAAVNLGVEYRIQGDFDAAEAQYRYAHDVLRRTRGEHHPHTLMVLNNWANVAYAKGDFATALRMHRDVQSQRRAHVASDDPILAQSASNVAKCYWRLGRFTDALAELDASPLPDEPAAARTQALLRIHLQLALGHFGEVGERLAHLQRDIDAAHPDVRGKAAVNWLRLLWLTRTGAGADELRSAWNDLQVAMAADDGRELVTNIEVQRWAADHSDAIRSEARLPR